MCNVDTKVDTTQRVVQNFKQLQQNNSLAAILTSNAYELRFSTAFGEFFSLTFLYQIVFSASTKFSPKQAEEMPKKCHAAAEGAEGEHERAFARIHERVWLPCTICEWHHVRERRKSSCRRNSRGRCAFIVNDSVFPCERSRCCGWWDSSRFNTRRRQNEFESDKMCGSFSLNISSHCFNFSFNSLKKSFVTSFCVRPSRWIVGVSLLGWEGIQRCSMTSPHNNGTLSAEWWDGGWEK